VLRSIPSAHSYFQRFGFCERQIAAPPRRDLGLVAVIPCFNEPDLLGALEMLRVCERPGCAAEVIVVINSSAGSRPETLRQNQVTLEAASAWAAQRTDPQLQFHFLHFPELPGKHASVGLARKIGMDEAARRFNDVGNPHEGIIVGFDADCRCERNYLTAIERHFRNHRRAPGCSIYFEHPLDGPLDAKVYEAVTAYELHLRYYVQALRYAAFPFAHHTIGSCMAVRADIYQQQGGMNKRHAGEDFYFLHKIIPLGGFTDLTETTVFPSPRPSDRVPFGTGKAVGDFLRGERILTYPPQAFLDLKILFEQMPDMYRGRNSACAKQDLLPESVVTFLRAQEFETALSEIRENTSSEAAFRKRFFAWFNGFRAMKFIHHARDNFYGDAEVVEAANNLLELASGEGESKVASSMRQLLDRYRALDKGAAPG